ncbi:MAG TPA: hypothetical protein VGN39_08360, partial [Terriglobales bacterium]|nr:hypothetical protein [Terriglobales bacterium]
LEKQRNGNGPQFLSDHPNPGNRREAIDREIRDWPPKTFAGNSDAFLRAKQHAMTVKTYTGQQIADEAKQGIWEQTNRQTGATPTMTGSVKATETGALANITFEQVRPSSDVTSLQQDAFTISYPENWHVFGGQQATMTIAPPAGVTQGAIGYGVVIALAQDQNANSLDEFTSDLVTNLQQSNSGLRQSGNSQRIQVSGQQADSVSLAGTSPVEQNGRRLPERDWLVTFQRQEGGFLYLIFIAPESDFERLRPAYQRMLDSLEIR